MIRFNVPPFTGKEMDYIRQAVDNMKICGDGEFTAKDSEWLEKKKAAGQIRKVGFSFHGSTDIFLKILDAYDWEFCLVQYNYLDENAQAGRQGVEEAARRGIPVFIMEPLRGGKLTKGLNKKAKAIVDKSDKTAAEWGLSWLYAQDTITCVLSGMDSMDVLEENIRIANNGQKVENIIGHFDLLLYNGTRTRRKRQT